MSIYNNIKHTVTKLLTRDSITVLQNPTGYEVDDSVDAELQTGYQNSLYITRALEVIQDAVSSIDFELYQITSAKGDHKEIEVSPILDLMYKPNPLQTKSEFWRILVINYKLSGEAFVRIIRKASVNGTGDVVGLLNLSPKDMEVELKDDGTILYKYHNDKGEIINLTELDVFHIKNPNPNSQLRGFSILRPILSRVEGEIKATTYQNNLFGHNGNPDGLLTIKGVNEPETLKKVKQSFYNSFRGQNESNRVAVIGGDASYVPLNSNSNTLDFIASKNNIRDEVFMALGVPKALITSDDVNRANADAALQQFMQFTIAPMFKMILEVINERFIIPNYGEQYYLDTEKLVVEDKEFLLKESIAGVNKWLSVNEVRQRFGYEPMEGHDEIVANDPFSSLFTSQEEAKQFFRKVLKSRSKLYTQLKTVEKFYSIRAKSAFIKMSSDPVYKLKFANAVNSVRDKGESILKRETKKFFKEQLGRTIKRLDEVGESFTTAGDIFKMADERQETMKYILPVYTSITVQAGNVALAPLAMLSSKANNFIMNSVLYKKLEKRAELFADQVTNATFEQLSILIADNIDKGVGEVTKLLKDMYAGMSTVRAERIARTESGYMTSEGSQMAYEQSDVVSGKEWLTTQDDRVREEHVINDGVIVGKDEVFPNGESFPAQHTINCRCAIAPVVDINNL